MKITHFFQRSPQPYVDSKHLKCVVRSGCIQRTYIDLDIIEEEIDIREKLQHPLPPRSIDTSEGDTIYDNVIRFFIEEKIKNYI